MKQHIGKIILIGFSITFILSAFTISAPPYGTSTTEIVGMIFERQAMLFMISLFSSFGTLMGFSIYEFIYKKKK